MSTTALFRLVFFSAVFLFTPWRLCADWVSVGPAPAVQGQDEGITSPEGDNPVAGAMNAVAPSAADANVIYVASVNGGVWKTINAKAASPSWTALTDQAFPSLSLASIAISPLDPNVIFAGAGRTSSLGANGGKLFGIGRSTDGGASWTVVGLNLADLNIRSIVPTKTLENGKQVVLAGTNAGVYRSADGGVTYTQVSTGIPADNISDMVGDPGVPTRFYAASGGTIYRSNDTGASWTETEKNGFTVVPGSRVLLSVHNSPGNDVVYAATIDAGALANVHRSADQGATWTALGVPEPLIFPGRQGDTQGAILADKTDPNTVWVSGDRQPNNTEIGAGPDQFPNPNGANNYSGSAFRNVSGAWQLMVLNGANGSSPHADSRAMAFDVDGNIIQVCDGGIFKLNDPNLGTRRWSSLNGNIRVTEAHNAAYDPLAKVFLSGSQDNGASTQTTSGNPVWLQAAQGDGGRVARDADQTAHAGTSFRYFCSQTLTTFTRKTYDATGAQVGTDAFVGLMITAGDGTGQTLTAFDKNIDFIQPYAVNQLNPSRLLFGTQNIYESLDQGETLTNLGLASDPAAQVGDSINSGASPIAYGSRLDGAAFPDVFYVGAGNTIAHRVTAGGAITRLTYPGGVIRGIVMDPHNYKRLFVLDTLNKVFGSIDEGATWNDLTANLATFTDSVRAMELFNPDASFGKAVLFAGGAGGVWQMANPSATGTWTDASPGLPKVLVYDLRYDYTDNVLSAGTVGRGVYHLAAGAPTLPTTLGNISTRLRVETGDNVLIGGFIVTGTLPKKVIIRGIGSSLPFADRLANPTLELRNSAGVLLDSNDDWVNSPNKQAIIDSTIPPANDLESAIIATLPANGSGYTAIVRGVNDGTGIGVVEAYDLSRSADSRLANISTRGFVSTGDNVLIAGTIVLGQTSQKVLVRAIAPSLTVPGKLDDPTLELRDANGGLIRSNDNWKTREDGTSQQAEIEATTIPPANDLESAIVATLPANNASYTAIVRGVGGTTGIAVVEVYALN